MRFVSASLCISLFTACGGRADLWSTLGDDSLDSGDGDSPQGAFAGGSENVSGMGSGGGSGGREASGGTAPGTGGGPDSLSGDVEAFCEEACSAVDSQSNICIDLYPCAENGECLGRAALWSDVAREAFVWCLDHDPLCFISAEGCMVDRVFGDEPIPQIILGKNLPYPDGTIVGVATSEGTTLGALIDGATTILFDGPRSADFGAHAYVWVDEDGDGECNVEFDRFTSTTPKFNGSFEVPLMVGEVSPDDLSFVTSNLCDGRF